MSAYGDGTTLAATWGAASDVLDVTTAACPLPEPAAPTTLTAGTIEATSVALTWDSVAQREHVPGGSPGGRYRRLDG